MRRRGVRLSREAFEREVARAIDAIPDPFASMLADVVVVVEDEPDRDTRAEHGPLLGLYEGIPLTAGLDPDLPPCITIFQGPHERLCGSLAELRAEIRDTVLHEVGHQFGLTHSQLEGLDT